MLNMSSAKSLVLVASLPLLFGCSAAAPEPPTKLVTMSGEGFSTMVAGELSPQFISNEQAQQADHTGNQSAEWKRMRDKLASSTRMYTIKNQNGYNGVSITDMPAQIPMGADMLKGSADGMVSNMGGKETKRESIKIGEYDGVHIEGEIPAKNGFFSATIGVAPDRHRLYQAIVVGNKSWTDHANQKAFIDSFKIVPMAAPGS